MAIKDTYVFRAEVKKPRDYTRLRSNQDLCNLVVRARNTYKDTIKRGADPTPFVEIPPRNTYKDTIKPCTTKLCS